MKQIFNFWLKPSQTLESIQLEDSRKVNQMVNIIFIFIALYLALANPMIGSEATNKLEMKNGIGSTIFSAFSAFLGLKYIYPFFLQLISKLFQGQATVRQIRIAQAYSFSPFLVFLPFTLIWYMLTLNIPNAASEGTYSSALHFIFAIIAFSYLIIGLSRVNRYSYGYGLATLLLFGAMAEILKLLLQSMIR